MAAYRSTHTDGVWSAVGILAAVLALAECVVAIILVNRPAIVNALGLPASGAMWATIVIIVAIVIIVVAVLIGVAPRRAQY